MLAGSLAIQGPRDRGTLTWLAVGLLCFTTADVVYALRLTSSLRDRDTARRALVDRHDRHGVRALASGPAAARARRDSAAVLAGPLVSTATAVGVLLWATGGPVPALTVAPGRRRRSRWPRRGPPSRSTSSGGSPTPAARPAPTSSPASPTGARCTSTPGATIGRAAARRPRRLQGDQRRARARSRGRLLREVARRLTLRAGPTDLIARLGGDEFAIVLASDRRRQPGGGAAA